MASWGLLGLSCRSGGAGSDEAAIREVLSMQENAWDRGDIPLFMTGYAQDVCFIGRHGRTCGREAVMHNYQRSYPDPEAMGDLHFEITEFLPAGDGYAWTTGNWRIVRGTDTLAGGFSLLWRSQAAGWRILRDHTY